MLSNYSYVNATSCDTQKPFFFLNSTTCRWQETVIMGKHTRKVR